ncbi:MAG: SurA N-terminal domain-containing protein [Deltaproteobacteria bacterium]|nr:SurA N-terminal domain-containing protein [Deltaproteobacteria bacterium]
MKKTLALLIFIPATLLAAETVDRIVAVVGTEIVTLSDLRRQKSTGKKEALNELIRAKILDSEIERLQISVSDDDMAQAIREVLYRNRLSLEQFKKELGKEGQGFERYKEGLRGELHSLISK